jgi:phosphonate transport system substrate-binding protein
MSGFLHSWIAVILVGFSMASCYEPPTQTAELGSEKNPIRMYFVPSTEAEGVLTSAQELATMLSEQTGLHVKADIAVSYVGIVEAMRVGQVHVGWLPPVAYVYAHERNGDLALLKVVRKGKASYRGQILVLAESEIHDLEHLKGKRISFPEQTSASGYYYPYTLLLERGIDAEQDIEPSFAGNHENTIISLLKGGADAACSYEDARDKVVDKGFPDVFERTRVLAYTAEIPSDNVTVAAGLDPQLRQRLQAGLLSLAKTDTGRAALKELYDIDGLEPADDSDWDPVRKMMQAIGQDPEREVQRMDSKRKS